MTESEHAERIHRTLTAIEKAVKVHHAALAAYAAEHGAGRVGEGITLLAAAPKNPPPND